MKSAASVVDSNNQTDGNSATTDSAPPAYSLKEVYRYADLGLGRGVDGTDPTPWLNKSSFQVRKVKYRNIIGTDDGGVVQTYKREVTSVQTQQTKIKASITMPKSPITIGADAEVSRSLHSSRTLIGRKVVNRTIAFSDDFDDVPFGEPPTTDDAQWLLTFEERLDEWIMEKLKLSWQHQETSESAEPALTLPSKTGYALEDLSYVIAKGRDSDMRLIDDGCSKFIRHFHITHYVHSITLGAAEYQVMTQEEYELSVGVGGKAGLENVAGMGASRESSSKSKLSSSELKRIGVITEDNTVKRGSDGEVVIDVTIRPITGLIRNAYLSKSMQKALTDYLEEQRDKSDGPFLICCGIGTTLYLHVNPLDYAVLATRDINQASEFYIKTVDDISRGANEFNIVFYQHKESMSVTEATGKRYSVQPDTESDPRSTGVALYLDAPVNICGVNAGPLYVRDTAFQKTSQFSLKSRIVSAKGVQSVSLELWTKGLEMYQIVCSHGFLFYSDSHIVVKKLKNTKSDDSDGDCYVTAADSTNSATNDVFHFFHLLPRLSVNQKEVTVSGSISEDGD